MSKLLTGVAWTEPANIFIALFTTAPLLDGSGGSEVSTSATGYQRVSIAQGGWTGPTGVSLEYSNTAEIQFGAPIADWGTIVAAGLYDSDTAGTNNLLFVSTLTNSKTVSNSDGAPKILSSQLRITRATC